MSYRISSITGGQSPIYPFLAPPEYLESDLYPTDKKREALIYYLSYLYPLTKMVAWNSMSLSQLQDFYDHLDFWYTFNGSWGVSPMPVTLSNNVVPKWTKNTFYQAGTIIQSSITSFGWDMDNKQQPFYLSSRLNNAPQTDSELTYYYNGRQYKIRSTCRDELYWKTVMGQKMEITSWGWNPYPFGIYMQGPLKGSGNFVQLPDEKNVMIGTCHWNIIWKSKAANVSDQKIWTEMMNHELLRITPGFLMMGNGGSVQCTPYVVIKKIDGTYEFNYLLSEKGGSFPLLTSYYCFIIGGFGGIGDPWLGNNGPFFQSFSKEGFQYLPVFQQTKNGLIFSEDQTIPPNQLPNFPTGRDSTLFWKTFSNMFLNYINRWDINWVKEMWRYPIFYSGTYNGVDLFENTSWVCNNPSDDFMQAMVTGNFNIVHHSPLGPSFRDPSLSMYSNHPLSWSHIQMSDGYVIENDGIDGFPTGELRHHHGNFFVIRTQMPNVNGDFCVEFADFRALTPGNLADGSGNQHMWKDVFTSYCKKYMFTVDPLDTDRFHSFDGDFEPLFPDVKLKNVKTHEWSAQQNVCINQSFYTFDPYSGNWRGDLAYTGVDKNGKEITLSQYPGSLTNGNIILDLNLTDNCVDISTQLKPTPYNGGYALQEIGGNISCYDNDGKKCTQAGCVPLTIAKKDEKYYTSPTDSFRTGVIGFQADGITSNIGACQTRWCISSKGIPWKFNAPLANRLLLKNGLRLSEEFPKKEIELEGNSYLFYIILVILIIVLLKFTNIKIIHVLSVFTIAWLLYYMFTKSNEEAKKLRVYFTLVYPAVPSKRWQNMSLTTLRRFFCALHHWFRGENLPSPVDYINTSTWEEMPPFGFNSSWKSFTTRKHCIVVSPEAINNTDGKKYIGYDRHVNTKNTETPAGILYRGRQILPKGNGMQQTTFFEPSANFYIDTFNGHASVNDTDIEAWKNVKYVEVSSQWGPFPDGAYFDWAQGSGVWLSLKRLIVGYSGLDVMRRVGEEIVGKIDTLFSGLKTIYFEEFQRTCIDNMKVEPDGHIYGYDTGNIYGVYGSIILTKAQRAQVSKVPHLGFWAYSNESNDRFCADGVLYQIISSYIGVSYYDAVQNKWVKDIPTGQGHIEYYPFPLPFGAGEFRGDENGDPVVNEYALKMPWKYQLFNVANMMRSFCIDALFLNEKCELNLHFNEYVDFLQSNQKTPLSVLRTWEESIDVIIDLMQKPIAHPFFSKYSRTLDKTFNVSDQDGPLLVLMNPVEWESGQIGVGKGPTVSRVQTGALDKTVYLQDTEQSKGVKLVGYSELPQLMGADLEIDHWMSALSKLAGYDTCARIQHWCGNKSLCYDIEIIAFRLAIRGNLLTNTLQDNIYEVWKSAYQDGWLTIRDPFVDENNVYNDVYQSIFKTHKNERNETNDKNERNATWNKPAWIGYDPSRNLYGWPCEKMDTFFVTDRLSYSPVSAEETGFSNVFPEYNPYLFDHFMRVIS